MHADAGDDADARFGLWTFRLLDLTVYVVVLVAVCYAPLAALAVALSAPTLIVSGGFVIGFLMFGYGTFLLWPSPPWDAEVTEEGELEVEYNTGSGTLGSREETALQRASQRLPPLSRTQRPATDRFSRGLKLFVASLAVLGVSYLTETAVL
ncbi:MULTISPECIES: DUF7555 family protein [Halolamina]|uniref:Uncharacterized protein n=1 Tax=Halolamina pelagica TaxID=699431 RepID=A0A1I5VWM3_9EURY|nr:MULTISPECIES: hypothetical protein [Halolamina]NHX37526.1 hypothetical protein [Halolamina sp. R1-12]SFQ11840.1 hypothetical protein SAMN05216277_1216 [Halolamina pelagica]